MRLDLATAQTEAKRHDRAAVLALAKLAEPDNSGDAEHLRNKAARHKWIAADWREKARKIIRAMQ